MDTKNLSEQYFQVCYEDENERGYQGFFYSNALKSKVRILVVHNLKEDGTVKNAKVYFFTNITVLSCATTS